MMTRKIVSLFAFCVVMSIGMSAAMAADAPAPVTLKGTLKCAKCSMKVQDKCQAVLVTMENGKEVDYFLKPNDEGKAAHKEICKADKENVTVTGTVTEKDGKKILTASKVE
jgi:hypothetical protein